MAHLSSVTKETRLVSKITGIVIAVCLLLFFSLKGYAIVKRLFFPTPPPGPEMGYGKLPQIQFPNSDAIVPTTYTINTIDGTLPADIPDRLNVYVLATPSASLVALQSAQQNASHAGFDSDAIKITDTIYQWQNSLNGTTLTYDIVTNNFTVESNLLSKFITRPELFVSKGDVIGVVNNFLSQIQANTSDIDQGKTQVIYLKNTGQELIGAQKAEESDLARVNFYQKSLGDITIGGEKKSLDIYYPYADRTLLSFTTGPQNDQLAVLQGQFINKNIVNDNHSTYPIITTQQAYEELQKGNAFIVQNPKNQQSIDISEVEMGYYLGADDPARLGQIQKYVEPIYVFHGLNGFEAYVPALAPSAICTTDADCYK